MRQAVLIEPKHIEFRDVPAPSASDLKGDEVLINVKRIGVCGSEIHSYHGLHPATFYPVVQGHEYSAQVVAVGEKVTACRPGDYVTGRPQLVCGECNPCKRGQYNVCSNLRVQAFQADGTAQDYFVINEDRVVVLPEGMSLDYGAMIEPVAVGAHATSRPNDLKGKNVVVSGAGTIGNLIAQFAVARGAAKVLITDVSDYRLEKARQCGISYTLNVAKTPLKDAMADVFGAEGFQVGFEVAGVEASVRSLMECIEKGGDVIIVGVHAKDPAISMFYLGEHELNLIGSMMYRHEDYVLAVEKVSQGVINLEPLVSNRFAFEEYDQAYKYIDENRETCMKVIIDLETAPSSLSRHKIIGVGEVLWDVFSDEKKKGGAPVNFAYFASQCGAEAHFISAVGNDPDGCELLDQLRQAGLDVGNIQISDSLPTSRVVVTLSSDGIPEYEIVRNVAWDALKCTAKEKNLVSDADALCWGSLAQRSPESRASILEMVDSAGDGCLKVFDINIRQDFYDRKTIEESLVRADVLKLNETELPLVKDLLDIEGDVAASVAALIDKYGLKYVILTCGADFSEIYSVTGLVSHMDTPEVEVADTVGAGDSFTAVFVTSLLQGKSIEDCHRKAVEISAYVCTQTGAMPELKDI